MTIIEWFDPNNLDHLKAYQDILNGKCWPPSFLPRDIEFPTGWFFAITCKLADLYMEEKLNTLVDSPGKILNSGKIVAS